MSQAFWNITDFLPTLNLTITCKCGYDWLIEIPKAENYTVIKIECSECGECPTEELPNNEPSKTDKGSD